MQWELTIQGDVNGTRTRRVRVLADNWFSALRSGLGTTPGQGTSIAGISCVVLEDGGMSIRDFITRRSYELRTVPDEEFLPEAGPPSVTVESPQLPVEMPEPGPAKSDARILPTDDSIVEAFERMQEVYGQRSHDEVAAFVLRTACEMIACEGGAFLLMRPGHNDLYVSACAGALDAFCLKQAMSARKGLLGFCIRNGAAIHVETPSGDSRFDSSVDWPFSSELRNLICVPVQFEGRTFGVLQLYNSHQTSGFSALDLNIGTYVAGAAAEYIERSLPVREPEQAERARSDSHAAMRSPGQRSFPRRSAAR